MNSPHDYYEYWDDSDVRALKEFLAQGLTISQIAFRMGRTYKGVESKLYRLRKKKKLSKKRHS